MVCFLAGSGCGGTRQTLTATETFQYLSSPRFPSQYPRYISAQHRTAKEQYSLMQLVTKNEFFLTSVIQFWPGFGKFILHAGKYSSRVIFVRFVLVLECEFKSWRIPFSQNFSIFKCSLITCYTIEKKISVNNNITYM